MSQTDGWRRCQPDRQLIHSGCAHNFMHQPAAAVHAFIFLATTKYFISKSSLHAGSRHSWPHKLCYGSHVPVHLHVAIDCIPDIAAADVHGAQAAAFRPGLAGLNARSLGPAVLALSTSKSVLSCKPQVESTHLSSVEVGNSTCTTRAPTLWNGVVSVQRVRCHRFKYVHSHGPIATQQRFLRFLSTSNGPCAPIRRGAKPADCSSRCRRPVPFMHSYMVMPEPARYRLKQRSAAVTYHY